MTEAARPNTSFADTTLAHIVEMVRSRTALTRQELTDRTGLGRAVVRQRVDLAIDLGLAEESGIGASTGGRGPRLLRFRSESGRLALAALGPSRITVGVSDLQGEILGRHTVDWEISHGPSKTLDEIVRTLRSELRHVLDKPLWGVGVGLPGPVEYVSGRPVAPPIMPGWNGFDVRGHLAVALDAPVWVDNDVNILALGERERLMTPEADNFMYVKVGTGIGAGLVSNGRIHRGADGAAGDIGHIAVAGSTTECRCGQIGCLEAIAGGWALVRDATDAARAGRSDILAGFLQNTDDLTLEHILQAMDAGDTYSTAAVAAAASTIGEALASTVSVFNPSLVIVGGDEVAFGEGFLARVREAVYRRSLPLATRNLQIVAPISDGHDGLRGAAALAAHEIFSRTLPDWVAEGTPVATLLAAQLS